MSSLQVFENEEFGKIRVFEIDGAPWFAGKDVATALAYSNGSRDINRHVDPEDRRNYRNGTSEINNRGITLINESGLYSLILSSKLPAAKRFKRWVTSDVLPSIRRHGAYILDAVLEEAAKNQDYASGLFRKLQAEQAKSAGLKEYAEALEPKARYCDQVLLSDGVVAATVIAKDYGMSAVTFNRLLHRLRIQFKTGGSWLLYSRYAGKGYTRTRIYCTPSGVSVIHTCWTQKGRLFLYHTLGACGILPLAEGRYAQMKFF